MSDITSLYGFTPKYTDELLFNINAGFVDGVIQERKYGANEDIDPGSSPELIRDGGGYITDYPYLTTNAEMFVVSDYALCTAYVHILGLYDNNGIWELKDTYATLNGTTPVAIGKFVRIYRIRMQTCNLPLGNIYVSTISTGIPTQAQTQALMLAGKGSTLMAMYTVPSNYTALVYRIFASCGRSQDATFSWMVRPYDKVFHTIGDVSLYESAWQGELGFEKIKEKSDIIVMASTLTNNTQARASFHFILVPNKLINIYSD